MTPNDVGKIVAQKTEPHRVKIGWLSMAVGAIVGIGGLSWVAYQQQQTSVERDALALDRSTVAELEVALRDAILESQRPIIIVKKLGTGKVGDEIIVAWPPSATALLGWTLRDIREGGLQLAIPEEFRQLHSEKIEAYSRLPMDERETRVIHTEAVHKNGQRIPVRVTTWMVGDKSRSIMAILDRMGTWRETRVMRALAGELPDEQ